MAKTQTLFGFARMTPAEYRDDLVQLRIPVVDLMQIREVDKLEMRRPRMTGLDDSD
jgi:hypothetical protein